MTSRIRDRMNNLRWGSNDMLSRVYLATFVPFLVALIPFVAPCAVAQNLTLQDIVTPSTIVMKDGHPVTFAIYGFIEFKSLSEALRYIDAPPTHWSTRDLEDASRKSRAHELTRRAVESRIVSMTDERPLELLLTHTEEELKHALARVKEPLPATYTDAFLEVRKKWAHSINCWSASPVIAGRVLSNWYPIEEGINLYGATYDSTEHFWQAVKYHPDVTIAQVSDLLTLFQKTDWKPWLAKLEGDPEVYRKNPYAIEFLHHNLQPERLQWFQDELKRQGLGGSDHARQIQQRGDHKFRFTAFEEKVLWGDLADLFQLVYYFSIPQEAVTSALAERHFDGIYLGDRKMRFISNDFSALMFEIWKVKYLQMPRFREVITSIPQEIRLNHYLNDGDSPDIPVPVYVSYLNRIRTLAVKSEKKDAPKSSGTTSTPTQTKFRPIAP